MKFTDDIWNLPDYVASLVPRESRELRKMVGNTEAPVQSMKKPELIAHLVNLWMQNRAVS